jgi:hypothetical protein
VKLTSYQLGHAGGWFIAGTDEAVEFTEPEAAAAKEEEEEEDTHVDMCMVCGRGGSLICCDGCPMAYHMPCVGETRASLPDDDWFCPECVALPQGLRVGPYQSRVRLG